MDHSIHSGSHGYIDLSSSEEDEEEEEFSMAESSETDIDDDDREELQRQFFRHGQTAQAIEGNGARLRDDFSKCTQGNLARKLLQREVSIA